MNLALSISHTPWRPERAAHLASMKGQLWPLFDLLVHAGRYLEHDTDYRGQDWTTAKTEWMRSQWEWHVNQPAAYHLLMTDDLTFAPRFWGVLRAMLAAAPNDVIGFLNNHPSGPQLFAEGHRWYRCSAWIVGPFYVMPHAQMVEFFDWWQRLPQTKDVGGAHWHNDDTAINQWLSDTGRTSLHPLPTIIDHGRDGLASTVGHGDEYSTPRVLWDAEPLNEWMQHAEYWTAKGGPSAAPILKLPSGGHGT
jgi:hypothetical protein